MYNLLINIISRQSILVPFKICINLVQFTLTHAFCQFMKHPHNSSSLSKAHSDIILSIPIAPLVPFPLLNPNLSSPSPSSTFLSTFLPSIFATIYPVYAMRLVVRWSLHFVASGFFLKEKKINFTDILRTHSRFIYVYNPLCLYSETTFSQHFQNIPVTSSSPTAFLSLISLTFSTSLCKI